MKALGKVALLPSLRASWNTINRRTRRASRDVSGSDEESVNDFTRNADLFLRSISSDLRDSKYCFSRLRPVLIKKPNGKDRLICVPTVRDRIVQGALQEYLSKDNRYGLDNGVSFGFVRGQGVKKAARKAEQLRNQFPFAYKADISSFFDSISRDFLAGKIKKRITERSLHKILFAASHCEVEPTWGRKQKRIAALGIKIGWGVRQGMPLSPFFSNLVLRDFDATIIKKSINMVRYADDLIIFAKSKDECIAIDRLCRDELGKLGLTIHELGIESKTGIYEPSETAEFLGVGIEKNASGYVLRVTDAQIENIKRELKKLADINELVDQNINLMGFVKRLSASIAGYEGSYDFCENSRALGDMLASVRVNILEILFTKGLGVKLERLTEKQRRFLGF